MPFLLAFEGRIARLPYLLWSLGIFFSQHLFMWLVLAAQGRQIPMSWKFVLFPLHTFGMFGLSRDVTLLALMMLAIMASQLLVAWMLAALAFQRTADAGLGAWIAGFAIAPIAQVVVIAGLSLAPTRDTASSAPLPQQAGGRKCALTGLLVIGLFAHMAMGGLLGSLRRSIQGATEMTLSAGVTPSLADLGVYIAGWDEEGWAPLAVAGLLAAAAFSYCFGDARFRSSWRHVLGGGAVGSCAVAGWGVTALAQDEFAEIRVAPASLSFIRPVAESIDYLTRFTGMKIMGFGVAVTLGCVAGALGAALATGRFRIMGFADSADTGRNLSGAALMGVGGVMALGCSIGQGVTGISTMAAGAVLGVKYLERHI